MRKTEQVQQQTVQESVVEVDAHGIPIARRVLKERTYETLTVTVEETALQQQTQQVTQTVIDKDPTRTALFKAFVGDERGNREFLDFCDQLAVLLKAGYLTSEALLIASRSCEEPMRLVYEQAAELASVGLPLSQAFAPFAAQLPDMVLPILTAVEAHGTQEEAVRQLAATFRRGIAVGHRFEYSVLGVSSFLGQSASEWNPGLITETKPRVLAADRRRLTLPFIGHAGRCLAMARWGRTFASLWNSGVPISNALEISASKAQSAVYAEALMQAAARTRQGESLRQSLAQTQLLPAYAFDIFETGELTGDYTTLLNEFAETLEDDAKVLAAQLFGFILICIAFVIGGLEVTMFGGAVGFPYAPLAGLAVTVIGIILTFLLFCRTANDIQDIRGHKPGRLHQWVRKLRGR